MWYFKYLKKKKIYNADILRQRYAEKLLKSHKRPIPELVQQTMDSPSIRGVTKDAS